MWTYTLFNICVEFGGFILRWYHKVCAHVLCLTNICYVHWHWSKFMLFFVMLLHRLLCVCACRWFDHAITTWTFCWIYVMDFLVALHFSFSFWCFAHICTTRVSLFPFWVHTNSGRPIDLFVYCTIFRKYLNMMQVTLTFKRVTAWHLFRKSK